MIILLGLHEKEYFICKSQGRWLQESTGYHYSQKLHYYSLTAGDCMFATATNISFAAKIHSFECIGLNGPFQQSCRKNVVCVNLG